MIEINIGMDLKTAIENTKKIYLSDSSMAMLMDFERVLDELDLYAFAHWEKGELVEGPVVERYWVSCTFMWPLKMMPDPRGAERLLPYGCSVSYEKIEIKIPMKIERPDDMLTDGSRKGKMVPVKAWLVKIEMPQELIADIEQGSLEIAGEEVDMEDINDAYMVGMDEKSVTDQMMQDDEMEGGLGSGGDANVPQI